MDWENVRADVEKIMPHNYTAGRSSAIKCIVIHHMAGNLTVEGCYNVWTGGRQASCHYAVESSGRIGQLVYDNDTAWHCGEGNAYSIGIEHADTQVNGAWVFTDECLDAGAHLVAALCKFYDLGRPEWLVNVFGHNNMPNTATACPVTLGNTLNAKYMSMAQDYYDEMTGAKQLEYVEDAVYRLRNPYSGLHMFTASYSEASSLFEAGYIDEGVAWIAPLGGYNVYRVYNPNNGDHLFTMSTDEVVDALVAGCNFEKVAFFAERDNEILRLYNPNSGEHFYTISTSERDALVDAGWKYEGRLSDKLK